MSQFPIPTPQATAVDTYVRPNPVQPSAPVRLGPGYMEGSMVRNDVGAALGRLQQVLMQYGPSLVASEAEMAKQQEEIRLARMDTDAVRADLMTQAKQMEKDGTLMSGSNPYRLMAIQEHLAVRTMQDEFEKTLAANLGKFSSPDNPEDPADFALETFQNMNLPGYFGKAKAASLYESMTSRWLSQVNQQKNVKVAARNREDLHDGIYAAVSKMYSDPTVGMGETIQRVQALQDDFYQLTGESGRDQFIDAFSALISNQGKIAAQNGDEDDIDRLQALLDNMRDSGVKSLQFGSAYDAEFDQMEAALDQFRDAAQRKDRGDDAEEATDISSEVFIEFAGRGELSTSLDSPFAMEMASRLESAGIGQGTISRILEGLPARVKSYRQNTDFDPDVLRRLSSDALTMTSDDFRVALSAAVAAGQIDPEKALALQQANFTANFQRNASIQAATQAGSSAIETADLASRQIVREMSDTLGLDFGVGSVSSELRQVVIDAGAEVARTTPPDNPNRDNMIREAMGAKAEELGGMVKPGENGEKFFDIEAARRYGLSETAINALERFNRTSAAGTVRPADISMSEVPGIERLDLIGGSFFTFGEPAFIEYADNISGVDLGGNLSTAIEQGKEIFKSAKAQKSSFSMRSSVATGQRVIPTEIRADGLYYKPYSDGTWMKIEDEEVQNQYAQAVRLGGLTVEELRTQRTSEGLLLSSRPEFYDPSLTVMADPSSFVADIQALTAANGSGIEQDELLSLIADTNLAKAYQAYSEGRGVKAVDFALFVRGQIGIMNYVGAPTPSSVLAEFRQSGSTPSVPTNARPAGQENN